MPFYLHDTVKQCLASQLKGALNEQTMFDILMQLQGDTFRCVAGRTTQQVTIGDKVYFIKKHHGVGWKEIFKNLLFGRLPILGAQQEWQALQQCAVLGIAVPGVRGYGRRGINPAAQQSFVLMEALEEAVSLEQLTQHWQQQPPPFALKRQFILEVAHMARALHMAGINHRDFYICHFLLKKKKLYLIDLHRAAIRKRLTFRWRVKDLAGLDFSSRDRGLTRRDQLRFIRAYSGLALRDILQKEQALWTQVKKRGDQLYREHLST
jgi:heptose I phosphotransferase